MLLIRNPEVNTVILNPDIQLCLFTEEKNKEANRTCFFKLIMLNMSLKAKDMRSHEFGTAVAEYIEG